MKFDLTILFDDLREVPTLAREAEALGADGLWASETKHDPFLPLAIAAEHTERLALGTAIAVAFPRSPMILAHVAWDLAEASGGRFILGLGTQVKGHNERRFSVKWSAPGPRLREVVLALHAIWDCWQNGTPLQFRGEHYAFTLMTPFFNPGPIHYPKIPIYLAAINPYNCRLVGELADGISIHPFHSVGYIRQTVLPAIEEGLKKSGRARRDVTVSAPVFIVTGKNSKELEQAKRAIKQQIAFYASTRTYMPVLETHGWGDLSAKLHRKSVEGDWSGMADLLTDEMLEAYAVVGSLDEVIPRLRERYDGLVDRISPYIPWALAGDRALLTQLVQAFKGSR
ncbi:MAG TPA: TIGR03617 family F420-dependent LLM class oxidoreductase [Methylomirabilota bacterium]|nr:TIGR03617 family F420-dependent LLM class oxidoreductase [Methylomirabilota bacterium]